MSFPAVVTLWFINTDDVAGVVTREPKADRGFGRKYLAQLNPAWPITPIGQFPLNRSARPSRHEFYIAGYPGVTIVQTFLGSVEKLSDTPEQLLHSVSATDVYVFAQGTDSSFAGFAHFEGSELKRSLCATRTEVFEDVGLPQPFEAPFWAGEKTEQIGGIALPFEPSELTDAAQEAWMGIDVSPTGPDINVVAYAVDGRPEPKVAERAPKTKDINETAAKFSASKSDYDDYEDADDDSTGDEFARLADASVAAAKRIGKGVVRRAKNARDVIADKIRHSDR
ncbi:DUF6928 family protein [Corynebacterium pilosum]|uniref:Uncharacterized protein n=2 Tax=Corynebacterium TaxID=1716 RepID=A0A376CQK0_9CORY|nr:hypothetical protein [Corynebacterium pilosum]STC69928.1 Uncharacterised protein [Corynebacterium pilosum]